MFQVGSVTNSPQKSSKSSPANSQTSTPERRSPVGSNEGVLGVDSLSTPVVDEHFRSQLKVRSVDSSKESVEGSPNAELFISDLHTPEITRRRSDTMVASSQEESHSDSEDVLLNDEELGIDFLGDEQRDQHSPLPNLPKSAMKQKGRESLDSIRSETERYLSPTMKKLYRESKGISNIATHRVETTDSVNVRELFTRTQSQVERATEYRHELESNIQKLGLQVGEKETALRELTMQYRQKEFEVEKLQDTIFFVRQDLAAEKQRLLEVKEELSAKTKEKESLRKLIENLSVQYRREISKLAELSQKLDGKETLNVDEAIAAKTQEIEHAYDEKFQVLLAQQREWQSEQEKLLGIIEKKTRRIEEGDEALELEKRQTALAQETIASKTNKIAELKNQNDAYVKEIEEFKVQLQQLSLQLAGLNGTAVPVSRPPERGPQILFDEDAIANGRFKEGKKQKEVSDALVDTKVATPSNSNRRLSGVSMTDPSVEDARESKKNKSSLKTKTRTAINIALGDL